ncbi:hypothetical protein ACHWQZ_G004107 [Mnemiopsis leidyi]
MAGHLILLLILLPHLVYNYHCYNQKCWGVADKENVSIKCDLEYNHCKADPQNNNPLCLQHFDTEGIVCGDQCKCEYDYKGEAGCHCPSKYIILLAVLLVGILLSGTSWFIYYRCRGRRNGEHNDEVYSSDI